MGMVKVNRFQPPWFPVKGYADASVQVGWTGLSLQVPF